MLETYCRTEIWNKCKRLSGEAPIVYLKGEPKQTWEFEHFFRGMSGYSVIWDFRLHRKRSANETFRYAVGFFARNGDKLADVWVNDRFDGDWKLAMRKYWNFDQFFEDFERYFAKRRQQYMDKTTEIIKALRPDLKDIKQLKTNSHGGVANLLKVLTKTMHEQGSKITSIAKMQYAVCLQAGIYLPDEFITDVLVAVEMDENILKDDAE